LFLIIIIHKSSIISSFLNLTRLNSISSVILSLSSVTLVLVLIKSLTYKARTKLTYTTATTIMNT